MPAVLTPFAPARADKESADVRSLLPNLSGEAWVAKAVGPEIAFGPKLDQGSCHVDLPYVDLRHANASRDRDPHAAFQIAHPNGNRPHPRVMCEYAVITCHGYLAAVCGCHGVDDPTEGNLDHCGGPKARNLAVRRV